MTIKQAYDYAKVYLANCAGAEPIFEAKQIIMCITGLTATEILTEYAKPLSDAQFNELCDILYMRRRSEPLQYIFGEWEFYGLNFKVGKGVLIPRCDTEILCEKAIEYIKDKPLKVIDLCSGSGCIAAAVAKNCPNACVFALEKERAAYSYLEQNIKELNLNVTPILDDIFTYTPEFKFDVILSNPPYIKTDQIEHLQREVLKEPVSALDGGGDGLNFYRQIAGRWVDFLNVNGKIFVEIGYNQAKEVAEIFKAKNLTDIKIINDYNGLNRVVGATKTQE